MKMELYELFTQLAAIHGPSGREGPISQAISKLATPFADELTTDVMGNLIIHRKGSGSKLMICAHMDTVGLVATYLEDNGSIRFGRLGGTQPQALVNVPVLFENGTAGAVKLQGSSDSAKPALDNLYVDIGAGSRAEAAALVNPGDTAVYAGQTMKTGNRIISPHLDNRIACAALLKVLERLKGRENDLYFVFSVQEEVGLRGAKPAAYGIDPDYALVVDVTGAYDYPDAPKVGSAQLGKGAAIKVMDTSVICHPAMVERLTTLATEQGIPAQMDVLTKGGTDAGPICHTRLGVVTGGVSIPCRYIHTPTEVADLSDAAACVRLISALAESTL